MALSDTVMGIAARAGFPDPGAVVAALHDQVVGAVLAQTGLQHAMAVAGGDDRLGATSTPRRSATPPRRCGRVPATR